jgi:hypothetical protein
VNPTTTARSLIRALIWTYFVILIFEGVLRKWIFPGWSNQLLLVRDPVLLLIYGLAISEGIFSVNRIVLCLAILGGITATLGLAVGTQDIVVTAYGFDACFLHLPLIFIIPNVMNRGDVICLGRWVLMFMIVMTPVMVAQFRSSPSAVINCGAGGGTAAQLGGAMGRIRPPGFFTFITAAAQFLALATAFVIYGWMRGAYGRPLLLASTLALILSAVVSTSRLVLGGIGVVFLMVGLIVLYHRKSISNVFAMLLAVGIILVVATNLDVYKEGRMVFEARLDQTGDAEAGFAGTASNWTERLFGAYYGGFYWAKEAPALGKGLGMGTNVGARVLTGRSGFLLAEGEPARVIMEMGPTLGMFYLILRVAICVVMYKTASQAARAGNALPMLLFGSCALLVSSGQFSQTTMLGFAALGGGMCLAAASTGEQKAARSSKEPAGERLTKIRTRSPYAERLHSESRSNRA